MEDNPTVILCTYINYHVRTPRQSKARFESNYSKQYDFAIQDYSNKTIKSINTENLLLIFQGRIFTSRHR